MSKKLSIYVHIPFCKSKCAYCDFYSQPSSTQLEAQMDLYQTALLAHFKAMSSSARGLSVDTIYFGGGTPTFYGSSRIDGLLRGLRKQFRVERDCEITVEGNPDSISGKLVASLRKSGVNRMSLGMQSASASELKAVGRIHSPQDTRDAVGYIKTGQIKNLSLDLIYGLPQQTFSSWQETLEEAIALEPPHLSCYGLKVEEGTPLFQRVEEGEMLPDEDVQADMYLWAVERLAQAGYVQYEISNFAKESLISRHNMGYWLGKPYLSFGASASSDFGGYRSTILADVPRYCAVVLEGGDTLFESHQLMTPKDREEEYLFLRLRTQEGLSKVDYEKATSLPFAPLDTLFQTMAREGWAVAVSSGHWRLTPQGYLRSNLLLGTLLDCQEDTRNQQQEQATKINKRPPKKSGKEVTPSKAREQATTSVDEERQTSFFSALLLEEGEDGQFRFL